MWPDRTELDLHRGFGNRHFKRRMASMLGTIAVILLVMWALGMVGGYAAGGLLHILLVAAVVVVVLRVVQGRRVV